MLRLVGDDEDAASPFPDIATKERELLIARLAFAGAGDEKDEIALKLIRIMNVVNYKRILSAFRGSYDDEYLRKIAWEKIDAFGISNACIDSIRGEIKAIINNRKQIESEITMKPPESLKRILEPN